MAIRVPKKTKKQRVNRKTGFTDIEWEGWEKWSGQKFHRTKHLAIEQYYTLTKASDNLVYIWTYMENQGYTKQDIRCAKAAPIPSPYIAIHARLRNLGMPSFNKVHDEYWQSLAGTSGNVKPTDEYLKENIDNLISIGKDLVAEKEAIAKAEAEKNAKYYKPTIQEVMREASFLMAHDIDEVVEQFIVDKDPAVVKKFDPVRVLRAKGAKPNHARIIRKLYEGELEEMQLINNIPTPAQLKKMTDSEQDEWSQIKEGYAHYDTKTRKAALDLYKKIVDACDIIIAEAKTVRKPRKVKIKSPEDLTKGIKFKVSDTDYGIASVAPAKLIGAVCAVMFNTKTRKLGIYVSADNDGFQVKGTSLQKYDEDQSLQKTLRKPKEVLAVVKKTTKAKTLKTFSGLTTTETKMNGRINSDTVILAVFK